MHLGYFAAACLSIAISGIDVGDAIAQDVVKIGVVIPMTGGFASVGREVAAGAKLYIHQHGDTVAGRKVELIIRVDAGVPDAGKRLAQELIVKDKVSFLGAGITPTAMAMAPLATEAKVATVVMVSGTSVVTERSPYYARTSFTLGQQSGIIADWATQNRSTQCHGVRGSIEIGPRGLSHFMPFTRYTRRWKRPAAIPMRTPWSLQCAKRLYPQNREVEW